VIPQLAIVNSGAINNDVCVCGGGLYCVLTDILPGICLGYRSVLFCFFSFLVVLFFFLSFLLELRASHLLGRCSIT
jgi:hypothetical protein